MLLWNSPQWKEKKMPRNLMIPFLKDAKLKLKIKGKIFLIILAKKVSSILH